MKKINSYNIEYVNDLDINKRFFKYLKDIYNSNYFDLSDKNIKYKKRYDGIKILNKLKNNDIYLVTYPSRNVENTLINNIKNKSICPLCISSQNYKLKYPYNQIICLLWRNFIILPNAFPYLNNHLLIQSSRHLNNNIGVQEDMHKYSDILYDIISLIKFIKIGTILFNGMIGNSQIHLHTHYTTDILPLQKNIKKYNHDKEIIVTSNKTKIYIYNDNINHCKNFIRMVNNNIIIYEDIFKLLVNIDKNSLLYNFIIFIKNNKINVCIFIREKINKKKNITISSVSLSGLHEIKYNNNINDHIYNNINLELNNYCKKNIKNIDKSFIEKIFK